MRSDTDIKKDVEAELRWSPDVDETDIAVSAVVVRTRPSATLGVVGTGCYERQERADRQKLSIARAMTSLIALDFCREPAG